MTEPYYYWRSRVSIAVRPRPGGPTDWVRWTVDSDDPIASWEACRRGVDGYRNTVRSQVIVPEVIGARFVDTRRVTRVPE